MTKATFTDNTTISVIAKDGEVFTLKIYVPVQPEQQPALSQLFAHYFEENFEDDKSSMVYWVLMKMMGNHSFGFYYGGSDRDEERKRIGAKIKEIREQKGIEAKHLASLANIDAANLSRIEQGRYSIGLDILSRIGTALGLKVDLVESS
jgi:DNA-binding Xre family transcriptional regulator